MWITSASLTGADVPLAHHVLRDRADADDTRGRVAASSGVVLGTPELTCFAPTPMDWNDGRHALPSGDFQTDGDATAVT
jgi:hypothetical protein